VLVTKLNRPTKRKYKDNQLSKGETTVKFQIPHTIENIQIKISIINQQFAQSFQNICKASKRISYGS